MKLAYVIGPYRADTIYQVRLNIMNAEYVALWLWKNGFAVICPHKNTGLLDGECPDETWLKGDIEILSRCDFAVCVRGWEGSKGSVDEVKYCKENGIPVYESYADAMLNELNLKGVDCEFSN